MADTEKSESHSDKESKTNSITIPSVSLPKGGGALKSIDEKFSVNAANGTASFSIPLPFSKARGNFTPGISLSYNSGSGNSVFGLGWNLQFSSIQRRTNKGLPQYKDAEESDVFMFTGVEDLVPELENSNADIQNSIFNGTVKRYYPRIEGAFNRIEKITPTNSATFYWKVTTKENVVTFYGRSSVSRIADPANPNKVFKWLPDLSYDDKGNCMEFFYVPEDLANIPNQLHEQNRLNSTLTNLYIKSIKYGNNSPYQYDSKKIYTPDLVTNLPYLFEAIFDYGDHPDTNPDPKPNSWPCRIDPFSDYHPTFEVRTYRLCKRVLFFNYFKELNDGVNPAPCLVRSIDFKYRYFNNTSATVAEIRNAVTDYITSIQQFGYKKAGANYTSKSLPPIEFTYQELNWNKTIQNVSSENIVNAPIGLGNNYQWIDLWNEGISGILTEQANGWFYKSNLGRATFTEATPVIPKPSFNGMSNGQLQLQDIEADGRKFIVSLNGPARGYFELSDNNEWKPFKSFAQLPNVDIGDANTKFIDLTGDGQPDIVVSEENVFTWYASLGTNGYDSAIRTPKPYDEEKGPALVFRDPVQSIFLADMSGDGLTDIVRIRNGEICYWPNMGYGKFGAKVNMDNAPVFDTIDMFNPSYLHLADVSGTGATDVLYLGKNQFKAWLNQSGNSWSETVTINPFPPTELPNQLSVIDFLGNGTACIVWSSALPAYNNSPMRYIDLMGGIKPYILSSYKNNMGKESSWKYKSSTYYYLQDKKNGTPWITKLPFPVQCVDQVNVQDKIAGTIFSNSYSYHHGYYDHVEREYRGFGRVEQLDSDTFDNLSTGGVGVGQTNDPNLSQAPIKTITWFHTGAYFNQQQILNQFEQEYTKGPLEFDLPQPILPPNLSANEYREALRACKGITLRQEIYGLDKTSLETVPYSVAAHNCLIKLIQAQGQNLYSVFYVHESEAVTFSYERNLNDPRIAHTLNLEVDNFGNVLSSASVVYGRKIVDTTLPLEIQTEQSKSYVVYAENSFTNNFDLVDVYRLPLVAETKTFELIGIPQTDNIPFTINRVQSYFSSAVIQKQLITNAITIYLKNDLRTVLPLAKLDTLAFVSQQFQLAFTPTQFTGWFGDHIAKSTLNLSNPFTEASILSDTKYVQADGVNWWIQSGTNVFINGSEAVSDAQQRFYSPVAIIDPYGSQTTFGYDDYYLMLIQTSDELGNTNIADKKTIDYRILQPTKLQDLNNNYSEIVTDELGLVIASSIYGQENDRQHGDAPLSSYTIVDPLSNNPSVNNPLDVIMSAPITYIQKATTYFHYDLFAWIERQQPSCFLNIVRETHESELSTGQASRFFISVSYSNGLGQIIQTKQQADPDIMQWKDNTIVDVSISERWIGSGRTIVNNKGNPVKQYEPFYSTTYNYETEQALVETGFSSVLFYDALSRKIQVKHPNGTFSRIEFDSWKQLTYDENDTVLENGCTWYSDRNSPNPITQPEPTDPEIRAAWLTAKHAKTPSEAHLDSLGRTIYTMVNNGKDSVTNKEIKYATQSVLDIQGNPLKIVDARGNSVMQYEYDFIGRPVLQISIDAGTKWTFNDVMNKPAYGWDSLKHCFYTKYDVLHRPTFQWLINDGDKSETLIGLVVYGETQSNANPNASLNMRGKVYQSFDQSGLVKNDAYDFKGNVKNSLRRLIKRQVADDYINIVNYSSVTDPVTLLEQETFLSSSKFDALNKAVQITLPDGSIITPAYNNRNLLHQVNATIVDSPSSINQFVKGITYNAKGQRETIAYGNNTLTNYSYDEKTYRLTQLLTTRNGAADVLQNLNYTYDPVGNITQIVDNENPTIFFNNAAVDPGNKYEYDPLYRLIKACSREFAGQNAACDQFDSDKTQNNNVPLVLPGDMSAMQRYNQQYDYDEVGNMMHMIHNAGNGIFTNRWTRTFTYSTSNNQLNSDQLGSNNAIPTIYKYDVHGNMLNLLNGQFNLTWSYANQLQKVDLGGGGTAYYVYDASGQRVKKVIQRLNNSVEERIYLGGYEIYREKSSLSDMATITLERQSIHIMDDKQRIALIEKLNPKYGTDNGGAFLIRYQYGNHLGSSCIELDDKAAVISYEEFYPFGSTAYQAMSDTIKAKAKRYRYTGMERDEESGLEYHSARYYAPWLARWTAADSLLAVNLFIYGNNNPVKFNDINGQDPQSKDDEHLTLGQLYEKAKMSFKGPLWDFEGKRDLEVSQWTEKQNQKNAEAEQQEKSKEKKSGLGKLKDWAGEKLHKAGEWLSSTKPGKELTAMDESLKETVGNVGSEGLDNTFGGIQRVQEIKGAETFSKAATIGRKIGEASYEIARDQIANKLAMSVLSFTGGKFKIYWNKQEAEAADYVLLHEVKLVKREAEIWLMKGEEMVKTQRRVDALLIDITSGEIEVTEWSTPKSFSESAVKKAQLQYQQEIFDKVKEGWTVLARPSGEDAFYDVSNAFQRTEVYPHWERK